MRNIFATAAVNPPVRSDRDGTTRIKSARAAYEATIVVVVLGRATFVLCAPKDRDAIDRIHRAVLSDVCLLLHRIGENDVRCGDALIIS